MPCDSTGATPSVFASGSGLSCLHPVISVYAYSTTPGAEFEWSGPGIISAPDSSVIRVNQSGVYTVTATHPTTGCTKTATWFVVQNFTPPAAVAAAPYQLSCAQQQVVLNGQGSTASPSMSYSWSGPGVVSGSSTLNPVVNQPGLYTLIVTNSNNGCSAAATVPVLQRLPVQIQGITSTSVTCFGGANGTASAAASGGTGTFNYQWSNGALSATATGLAAGVWNVTASDSEGCSATGSIDISQASPLLVNMLVTAESVAGGNDGVATALPGGGNNSNYTYSWSNGWSGAQATALAPGTYTVTVSDGQQCTGTQVAFINRADCTLDWQSGLMPLVCHNGNNALVEVYPVGAQGAVQYEWENGTHNSFLAGIGPGIYVVTISDASGCRLRDSVTVPNPPAIVANVVTHPVRCSNEKSGYAEISVTGTTGDQFSFVYPPAGSLLLGTGSYSVTVTDASGCQALVPFEIEVRDTIPPVITCPASIARCDSGNFTNYSDPVVLDNCVSEAPLVERLEGLPSGAFFPPGVTWQVYRATDASGNTATCSFSITTYPIPDIQVNSIVHDLAGAGEGEITVTPIGGTTPFSFLWKKDGDFFAGTEDLTGLFSGKYSLTMTDYNACTTQLAPITILGVTGTDEAESNAKVKLSPNPAADVLNITCVNDIPEHIEIWNTRGQLVRYLTGIASHTVALRVNDWPAGTYYVVLSYPKGDQERAVFIRR